LNFGIPSADADVVASVNADGTYPTLFVYDKGDKLADGSVAPNKRIGLFLGQAANPTANYAPDINNLTDAGKTLLLNTLAFAAGAVTGGGQPNIASVSVAGGNLTLTWTGGAGPFKVQRRDDIATGAWADVTTTNDRTASVPRTGNAGFLRVVGQ
jgi:hypothetical protein